MIIIGVILLVLLTGRIKEFNRDVEEQDTEVDIQRELDKMNERRGLR